MDSWSYNGTFLDDFENRNFITQRVVEAYRGLNQVYLTMPDELKQPAKSVTEMLERIECDIDERMARDHETHKPDLAKLLEVLNDDETIAFCRFIAKREHLPPEDKAKAKKSESEVYINKALSKKPPTIKQLEYLKSLGCEIVPGNMHEASVLINKFKK
jgi:hypothetical protein